MKKTCFPHFLSLESAMAEIPLELSFDDVLLTPQFSEVIPSETETKSSLTKDIKVNIPIISAAMDTVTESDLAIALAREGGVGLIHRACSISDQANMIGKVKRSESAVIHDPLTVHIQNTVGEIKNIMMTEGFSGFPVVDEKGVLLGMVTGRDVRYLKKNESKVSEVMTPLDKLVTGSADTTISEARRVLYENRIEKLPLIYADGTLAGLITGADIEKRMLYNDAAKDTEGRLRCAAAVGVGEDFMERALALIEAGADALSLDAATGHTKRVMDVIQKLKSETGHTIIAGNVVTEEGAQDLIKAGADAIKIGVGPGSICTTRVIAGVGMPQLSAVQKVSSVCREHGVIAIADGGIRYSGDIVKALAAGADMVMLGSLLAGTKESPGQTVHHQGRRFKSYRGMGSLGAMNKGANDRYAQNSSGKMVAEGVEGRVPYKGPLEDVIYQLVGGLKSGMGYVGAHNIKELRERAKFIRITPGGLRESHAHDIVITQEPTNYQQLS